MDAIATVSGADATRSARAPVARSRLLVAVVNVALAGAAALLVTGFFAPLLTVKRLLFFSDTISLVSALGRLTDEGELALFALLVAFSVVFPVVKLSCLFYVWNLREDGSPRVRRAVGWLVRFGKWSMLDVFVVALLVVTVRLRWIADVEIRYGVFLFGGSVLLTMLLGGAVARRARPPARPEAGSGPVPQRSTAT